MPTVNDLKRTARNLKIRGRSKMDKAQLIAAITAITASRSVSVKSKKPAKKKSRKPRAKKSRKPAKKKSRKPVKKKSRKPAKKKPAKKKSRKPAKKKPAKRKSRKPAKKKPAKRKSRKPAKKKPAKRKSRKPAKKKPAKRKSRKPAKRKSRKPAKRKSRKPAKRKSRKPAKRKSRKPVVSHKSGKYSNYEDIISAYVNGDDKAINTLTIKRRNDLLNSVTFHGTKFGPIDKFRNCLEKTLGKNWAKRVLDKNDKLSVKGVKRLGVPGRQGTTIGLEIKCCTSSSCKMYAVKVARKGTSCGDGATGGMGFLKQARMQQLASEYGVTPPVDAVYCGHKKEVSFMVMPVLAHRVVDVYKRGSELSEKHQKQLWNLYKTLDTKVGILHNDLNCLNIMIDGKDNVKLIDFDRSKVIEKRDIKKWGPYINISFLDMVNCFSGFGSRGISPGEKLIKNYLRVHGSLDNYDSFVKNTKILTFNKIRPHLRNKLVLRRPGITNWCDKKGSGKAAHNPSNCAMQFKFRMHDDDQCAICLRNLDKGGTGCPAGTCKGKFCEKDCEAPGGLYRWLKEHKTCPMCRGQESREHAKERTNAIKRLERRERLERERQMKYLRLLKLGAGAVLAGVGMSKVLDQTRQLVPSSFLIDSNEKRICFDDNFQGIQKSEFPKLYKFAENYWENNYDKDLPYCGRDRIMNFNPYRNEFYMTESLDPEEPDSHKLYDETPFPTIGQLKRELFRIEKNFESGKYRDEKNKIKATNKMNEIKRKIDEITVDLVGSRSKKGGSEAVSELSFGDHTS